MAKKVKVGKKTINLDKDPKNTNWLHETRLRSKEKEKRKKKSKPSKINHER